MKKLLLLGGSRYILPVIKTAHRLGTYVITCDYLPDNIAHKYSDEYWNISIIDKDEVLKAAQKNKIDGIMSFACDPGVVTAAYVAEKMGLPFQCSYESACILQDKGLFRKFLWDNGFNCPHSKRYTDPTEPFNDVDFFIWPVIVKPVDSAGSKGVTRCDSSNELSEAIQTAVQGSHNGAFIIEDFLTFKGYHSSADLFTVNGELKFVTYSDHRFDQNAANQYTPVDLILPSTMASTDQKYLTSEIQRLMNLLHMKTGIYNVETCIDVNGKPYIMEVSPRGGGCKIAELEELAMGANLIENEVRSALGIPIKEIFSSVCNGHWCKTTLHMNENQMGFLKNISFDTEIKNRYIKLIDLSVKSGDAVHPFTGANTSLGDVFLRFESREELDEIMNQSDQWIHIEYKKVRGGGTP